MKRGSRLLLAGLAVALASLPGTPTPELAAQEQEKEEPSVPQSVLEGAYTEEQATRGESVFAETCSYCHAPSQFTGSWLDAWYGSPVLQLYELIATTMPFDGPGRLSPQQYADVVAYILAENGYPAGERTLPADRDALDRIRIEKPDGGGSRR